MIKEVVLDINKKDMEIIKNILGFYVKNWEERECRIDEVYRLIDGKVFYSEKEFDEYFFNIPRFNRKYQIDDNVILHIDVDTITEMGLHGYMNNSLYTNDGKLLVHNCCKYDEQDLIKGLGFSTMECFHNENEIFEITNLGKEVLSQKAYIVKFKLV